MSIDIRQKFHLEPNVGLLNDPNGLIQYKGIYYVFFQWNRFEKNHTYKEWGLFTSKNLKLHGSLAIIPKWKQEQKKSNKKKIMQ